MLDGEAGEIRLTPTLSSLFSSTDAEGGALAIKQVCSFQPSMLLCGYALVHVRLVRCLVVQAELAGAPVSGLVETKETKATSQRMLQVTLESPC